MPDWWFKKPPEVRGDDFYIRAFWELSSERQFGGGSVGPIPWSKIVEYGQRRRLDVGMIELLEYVIREMDEAYLRDLRELQERQRTAEAREARRTKSKRSR